ncbi:MAG: aldo/keto reductase [Lachnospiraceae bacterium]|nr:aldo/keto reductase [Lachnospiraceae bacterium]
MHYRTDKYNNKISLLGFGCMRFQTSLGKIDMAKAEEQIMAAYHGGVNYYDTAYVYPGSESAIGEIFEKNGIRDSIYIATKLPHYLIKSLDGLEKLFQEQLRRLRTDHIDYYLMHMLSDIATWNRLKDLGIEQWLADKKASGVIRQIGFSYHGNSDMFCQLVDAYPWEFCQIQYNYMDEHTQAGRKGLNYAHEKGLPVIIMEPLRGGRLVNNLPEDAKKHFAEYKDSYTPAQWAFRWLYNQPEVTCVLSGMNTMEMIAENMETASTTEIGSLGDAEEELLKNVVTAITSRMKVGCTGCGYCLPCPKGVDIPGTFAAYNRRYYDSKFSGFVDYMTCTALRKNSTSASNCVGCGKCETHCPQHIAIRDELKNASKELEGPVYKIARKCIDLFKAF